MEMYKELLADYVAAVKSVEYWKTHGTWGDGELEKAKARRKVARTLLNAYVAAIIEGGK